jgi:signal transduction histidine kinase/DNA-binding response OmpR family regulator/ligand-binding sensor domain-containing protein
MSPVLRRVTLFALLIIVACQHLAAQEQLLPVFRFQHVDGIFVDQIRSRVVRDQEGFAWVGTLNGLERFDGYGVRDYRTIPGDPYSLSTNYVPSLLVDRKGRLWVGTFDAGLSLFDRSADRFINLPPRTGDSCWYQAKTITRILEDRKGNIWLASRYNGVVRMEIPSVSVPRIADSILTRARFTTFGLGTPHNTAIDLYEREDGKILVASDSGLLILDPSERATTHFVENSPAGRTLSTTAITCLYQDSRKNLWVGTKTDGVYQLDSLYGTVANYRHRKNDPLSLSSDNILDIAEDQSASLWIGNDAALDLFSPAAGERIPYLCGRSSPGEPTWMRSLSVDWTGTLWVATAEGGVHWLSPKSRTFSHYSVRAHGNTLPRPIETIDRGRDGNYWLGDEGMIFELNPRSLSIKKAIDVFQGKKATFRDMGTFIDRHGTFWLGTFGLGLFRIDLKSGRVSNYGPGSGLGRDLTVNSIAQGPGDTLWVAAHYDGLMKFDPATGRFSTIAGFPKCEAWTVKNDRLGRLWVCSSTNGVYILDSAMNSYQWLHNNPLDPHSLGSDHARKVYEDPSGRIWIGSGNILHLSDPKTGYLTRYINQGFNKAIFAEPLGSDSQGRPWIDFLQGGLAVLDPSTGLFSNFDASDGLCDNLNDMEMMDDGKVLLGTFEGLNICSADSLGRHRSAPPFVITRMSIHDEPAPTPILHNGFSSLSMPYSKNVLEFEFAVINFDAPTLARYQYQLQGFEKEWVKPEGRRFARYTNLAPGDYVFRVRAASSRNEWPEQEIALSINITPPWWRSLWAYSIYGLVLLALSYTGYRLRLQQVRLKQQAEMEHFQAEHLAEVDRLKSRFFSNISHEFRTPLTLILGPAEQGIETTGEKPARQKFHLILDNARKLHFLVSQLLDFSRLESGIMRLQVSCGDIVSFLRRVVLSFESWAERKQINLEFHADVESVEGNFDHDKLEKIVNNLMSNALKFTSEGGTVRVAVAEKQFRTQISDIRYLNSLTLSISDTGPGISAEHLSHIFDRFYRVDETHNTEGTGIGLALTKELVELHHGRIAVESTPGKGSVFTVEIPIDKTAYKPNEITETAPQPAEPEHLGSSFPSLEPGTIASPVAAEGKPVVLVVEDNADLRAYIREYLQTGYAVQEAADGKEGFERATESVPDLVISDVMMPRMDGMELCRALKQDIRTSHVPVILLTARAGTDSKIEGLEFGADDYVTKPFDSRELVARVQNLILQRQQLREKFSVGVVLRPGDIAVTTIDDALLKMITEAVEKNLGNEDFGVDDLAHIACLSRTHLNRKLQALTNLSPGEFIRYMRLQRARDLLEKNAGSIAEIAYQVGYANLSYFTASFKERFGILPSETRPSS